MAKKGQYKNGAKASSVRQRKYNSSPEQKKRRAQRNKARRQMEQKGKVSKGDGKDVDHKNKNTAQGGTNLRVRSRKANRADNRGTGGRKKK